MRLKPTQAREVTLLWWGWWMRVHRLGVKQWQWLEGADRGGGVHRRVVGASPAWICTESLKALPEISHWLELAPVWRGDLPVTPEEL